MSVTSPLLSVAREAWRDVPLGRRSPPDPTAQSHPKRKYIAPHSGPLVEYEGKAQTGKGLQTTGQTCDSEAHSLCLVGYVSPIRMSSTFN